MRFRVSFSSRSFIREPQAICSPSPMYCIPNRNAPSPPKSEIILVKLTVFPLLYCLCKIQVIHSLQVYQSFRRIATFFSEGIGKEASPPGKLAGRKP